MNFKKLIFIIVFIFPVFLSVFFNLYVGDKYNIYVLLIFPLIFMLLKKILVVKKNINIERYNFFVSCVDWFCAALIFSYAINLFFI